MPFCARWGTTTGKGVVADGQRVRFVRIAAFVLILVTAGCASVERAPPRESPQTDAAQGATATVSPAPPPAPSAPERPQAAEPATPSPALSGGPSIAKPEPPSAKAPAKAPPSPAPSAQPVKPETSAPVAKKPDAPPPLDLASLETRLKESQAIGVMTKIALKNQVDDLLDQFRAFYAGKLKTTLAELRRPYDLLVLKVLSLLQDSDPSLAAAIVASREAIWGILSDPVKFAKFAST